MGPEATQLPGIRILGRHQIPSLEASHQRPQRPRTWPDPDDPTAICILNHQMTNNPARIPFALSTSTNSFARDMRRDPNLS